MYSHVKLFTVLTCILLSVKITITLFSVDIISIHIPYYPLQPPYDKYILLYDTILIPHHYIIPYYSLYHYYTILSTLLLILHLTIIIPIPLLLIICTYANAVSWTVLCNLHSFTYLSTLYYTYYMFIIYVPLILMLYMKYMYQLLTCSCYTYLISLLYSTYTLVGYTYVPLQSTNQ